MSRATQVPAFIYHLISCKGLSPATVRFSTRFYYDLIYKQRRSYYPNHAETSLVWALPRSLATTSGITVVFFSCGYLDVSVPRVRLTLKRDVTIAHDGFPHSDICGSFRICRSPQLFAAYHVLLRLREPQASPMRPCSLSFCLYNEILVTSYLFLFITIFSICSSLQYFSFQSSIVLFSRYQYVNVLLLISLWRITDSNR